MATAAGLSLLPKRPRISKAEDVHNNAADAAPLSVQMTFLDVNRLWDANPFMRIIIQAGSQLLYACSTRKCLISGDHITIYPTFHSAPERARACPACFDPRCGPMYANPPPGTLNVEIVHPNLFTFSRTVSMPGSGASRAFPDTA